MTLTSQERNTRKTIALEALDALVLDTLERTEVKTLQDLKAVSQLWGDYQAAKSYIHLATGLIK